MHRIVRHGLLAVASIALIVGAARLAIDASGASFSGALSRLPLGRVLLGIGLYSLAHLLRVARLAMILGNSSLSLRRITQVQLFTAGVSLALPFKIGELFRVCELNHLVRDFGRSVLALWIERTFDVALLCALVLLTLCFASDRPSAVILVSLAGGGFVAATAVMFFVIPESLRGLAVFIIRRYNSRRSVSLLRFLARVQQFVQQAPEMVRNKVALLTSVSLAVWTLEIAVLVALLPFLWGHRELMSGGPLLVVSGILSGQELGNGLAEAAAASGVGEGFGIERQWNVLYRSLVCGPLFVLAAIALLTYLPYRLRHG